MASKNYLLENKKMSNLTWFGVGGYSKYYFQPSSEKDLVSFLKDNELYVLGSLILTIDTLLDKFFTKIFIKNSI